MLGAALFLCGGSAIAAADAAPALQQLQQQARQQRLAEQPYWHTLLHYEQGLTGAVSSTVDSDWFFLAPQGHEDPAAELDATLAAFFDPQPREPRREPAQCIFGARYAWLSQQLDFEAAQLPQLDCAERDEWMGALAPDRVWVVFPSAYMNSPSSMFGHTLLRLDGREVRDGTPLLAYAVNFAANTTETNGLVFAVRGLTGGYYGQFSVLPYYEKVKEYARLESRDLWEYPLDLTPGQIRLLLLHLWELRGAEFTYYFFTKNCSYQLLTLLQAARPDLQWGDQYRWRAIPIDTLRSIAPLSGDAQYRPALATQLVAQARQLGSDELDLALDLARGERAANDPLLLELDAQARARVLSLANDALYFRFLSGALSRDESMPRSRALLGARAATGERSDFDAPPQPALSPVEGHATRRFAFETHVEDGDASMMVRLRPAYHDLLDDPRGYTDGQQINFLDLAVGADLDPARWRWSTSLIDIVSVAPRSELFRPISWRVRLAGERADYGRGLGSGILEGGPGLAYGDFGGIVGYGFLFARFEANKDLDRGQSLGVGPMLGLLARPLDGWQLQFEAATLPTVGGQTLDRGWVRLGQQWQLSRNLALRLELGTRWLDGERSEEGALGLQIYY
ncbi:MAG: DUF4105 domain-containing protein [Nevskiales bacterium]|nr:DUF4105 domain-containing protein [Nevskiales bacterium]